MAEKRPRTEQPYNAGETTTTSWTEARGRLETAESFWLATVRLDGRPHVVPVLAVWVDDALHVAASATSRKAINLAHDPHCVVTTSKNGLDLVLEGEAARAKNEDRLRRIAGTYASKYGWQVDIRDGAFHAEGAPTAGPPPFDVYEITLSVAFGFPTDGTLAPTRWKF